jgi:hypothetical protein
MTTFEIAFRIFDLLFIAISLLILFCLVFIKGTLNINIEITRENNENDDEVETEETGESNNE